MATTNVSVVAHAVPFDYTSGGRPATTPLHFWSRHGDTPDTILFLGIGQNGKIPRWVAEQAPPGVVVVEGLPYWLASASQTELETFIETYVRTASLAILDTFSLTAVNMIASSQATYGVVRCALQQPDWLRTVGLLFPFGLTANSLGTTPQARLATFKRRLVKTLLQKEQSVLYDMKNAYIGYKLARIILRDGNTASNKKFALALSYDLVPAIKQLTEAGRGIVIALAEHDQLFQVQEVTSALRGLDTTALRLVTFPNATHSSLAIRPNRDRLKQTVRLVRQHTEAFR